MKKSFFCLVLSLAVVFLSLTTAHALIDPTQDARYLWKDGGTFVDQLYPVNVEFNIGSPTGGDYVQIDQKDFVDGNFTWVIWNDNYTDGVYSFHITNDGFTSAQVVSHSEPDDWTFSVGSSYFEWTTDTNPIALHGFDGFGLVIPSTAGKYNIGPAAVDVGLTHTWKDGNGLWATSYPAIPEPASMSLLGLGLLGLVGAVRKKFMA